MPYLVSNTSWLAAAGGANHAMYTAYLMVMVSKHCGVAVTDVGRAVSSTPLYLASQSSRNPLPTGDIATCRHDSDACPSHIQVGLSRTFGRHIPDVEIALSAADAPGTLLSRVKPGKAPPPVMR